MAQLFTTSVVDFRKVNNPAIQETKCLVGNNLLLKKTTKYKQLIPDYHLLKENVILVFEDLLHGKETIEKLKQVFPTKTFTCLSSASLFSLFPEIKKTEPIITKRILSSRHWANVLKNLYIGDAFFALNDELIQLLQIQAIINITPDTCPNLFESDPHFSYFTIYEQDTEETTLRPYFYSTNRFIDNHILSSGVLVHCATGVSHSSTIVIAYLMHKLRLPFTDAFHFLQERYPQASPNLQFYHDLTNFEKDEIQPKV
jgi:hypothetical protein